MNKQLEKRLESLLWRAAMLGIAAFLDVVVQELASLNMPDAATVVIGLILGEISKHLHNIRTRKA